VFASDRPVNSVLAGSTAAGGRVLASLGFNPTVDGFSFQNYGFIAGTDLDQHAMRELFGNVVCATAPSDSCTLTPNAQNWAQQHTPDMWGGHCFGFSMTALRFFKHLLSSTQFGGSTPYSLSLSPALQSEIAYAWVTQVIPNGPIEEDESITGLKTPMQMVHFLVRALANRSGEAYSLAVRDGYYQGSDGHIITPIAIVDRGGGHYQIRVYDNNHPGTTRSVNVYARNDSWTYQLFDPPGKTVWGGSGTNNEMAAVPLSDVLRRQPCPFCGGPFGAMQTISLGGDPVVHGHLLITDSQGRRLGFVGGRFVNQIKGARVIRPALNDLAAAHPEPIYQVPARDQVTVTLEPSPTTYPEQVSVTAPGFGLTVSNVHSGTSSAVQFSLAPGSGRVGLRVRGQRLTSAPMIELTGGSGRVGDRLLVTPKPLAAGARLELSLSSRTNRSTVTSTAGMSGVTLTLQRVGPTGIRTLQNKTLRLAPSRSATFR
jgi:hypothetical protein